MPQEVTYTILKMLIFLNKNDIVIANLQRLYRESFIGENLVKRNKDYICTCLISICACRDTSMHAFCMSDSFTFDKTTGFYEKSISIAFMY